MSGPLHGYKIIELTSTVSGPVAGMILGDQGADIIKIEPPMIGDLARHMGDIRNGVSAMYATLALSSAMGAVRMLAPFTCKSTVIVALPVHAVTLPTSKATRLPVTP